jgi:hypothetical protein
VSAYITLYVAVDRTSIDPIPETDLFSLSLADRDSDFTSANIHLTRDELRTLGRKIEEHLAAPALIAPTIEPALPWDGPTLEEAGAGQGLAAFAEDMLTTANRAVAAQLAPAAPAPAPAAAPCGTCADNKANGGFGPSHDGSPYCKSGSIASGGTRAHCTCDTCF